jgi:hypothetical protein
VIIIFLMHLVQKGFKPVLTRLKRLIVNF